MGNMWKGWMVGGRENILRLVGIVETQKKRSPLFVYGDSYGDSQSPIQIFFESYELF